MILSLLKAMCAVFPEDFSVGNHDLPSHALLLFCTLRNSFTAANDDKIDRNDPLALVAMSMSHQFSFKQR